MDVVSMLLLAVGLAFDAFAVSLCSGLAVPRVRVVQAATMAAFFGGFQALMPVVGWLGGLALREPIAPVDHWVAFALLVGVGGNMIRGALRPPGCEARPDPFRLASLLVLAVATSIDALAVGIGLSLLDVSIVAPVIVIGAVTFVLSFAGVQAGRRFGTWFGNKVEIVGGLILIGIGVRILVEHLAG